MTRIGDERAKDSAVSRRTLLGATIGLFSASGVLSAAAQEATPVAGVWSFTDDKGVTVELPERPLRILADVNIAAPLWDFGVRPVAVFGWNASLDDDGQFGAAGGRIDPTMVEFAGDVTEPIRLEDAVAMQPDLILTITHAS